MRDRYLEQDPATVGKELIEAANVLAGAFEQVSDRTRPRARNNGAHFTIETFARYLIHDLVHHLWDLTGERAGMNRAG